ncbi:MAG: hypothetical protein OXQ31_18495 [Spirochaetaceae bacterium]|nr:hypothetical protein [Spirochaetaceae bacterium]
MPRGTVPPWWSWRSNGSSVATSDLDGDGDLALVLGNLDGRNAIF